MVAVPFWVAYTSLLTSQGWITLMKNVNLTLYLTGIGLGTFLALALFAQLSGFLQKRFAISSTLMNRAVGWLMVATSLYQALHLII